MSGPNFRDKSMSWNRKTLRRFARKHGVVWNDGAHGKIRRRIARIAALMVWFRGTLTNLEHR